METITDYISLTEYELSFFPNNALFFDIETLGLTAKHYPIYLIGCLDIAEKKPKVTLFFANSTSEERDVLSSFLSYAKDFNTLITFNGASFDIPYVYSRAKKYGMDFNINCYNHIDIYKAIRPYKSHLNLKSLSQKSIEEFLGITRDDKYDGGRLINVYREYEKSNDLKLKDLLILHNYDDVCGMTKILPMLSYSMLKGENYNIVSLDIKEDEIVFRSEIPAKVPKPVRILKENYHFKIYDNVAEGVLYTKKTELKMFLKNIKDYIYLPNEDMVIPKSMAAGIPKGRKEPANRENCCVKVNGLFFKLSDAKAFSNELYKSEYSSKDCYYLLCKEDKKESLDKSKLSELIIFLLRMNFF